MVTFLVAATILCVFTVGESQINCRAPSTVEVYDIQPRSGTNGTRVTISGCGLVNVKALLFNSTHLNSFRVDSQNFAVGKNDGLLRFRIITNSPPVGFSASVVFLGKANMTLATLNSSYWKWLKNVQVRSLSSRGGQSGTIFRIRGCFPPQCASESMLLTNITIGGIEAKILNQSAQEVELRAGYSDHAISSASLVFLAGSGATYTGSVVWNYLEPGRITGVSPNSGQRGTRVTITGESLLGVQYSNNVRSTIRGNESDIKSVTIAGLKCVLLFASSTVIIVEVPFGPPTTGGIFIETNAGPYIVNRTAWRKTEDGTITSIIPSTMQPGGEVALCGVNILSDEAAIMNLTMAGQTSSKPSFRLALNSSCIIVQTPLIPPSFPLPPPGSVLLIADTFATVVSQPGVNFTYARIDSVFPVTGRQGTKVIITGSHLDLQTGGVDFVYLSGIPAQIISVNPYRIVVRAGIGPSLGSTLPGSVKVIGKGNSTLNGMIALSLTLKSAWKYIPVGIISHVIPSEGQIGTRVTISGQFLLGLGGKITQVGVGTNMAIILSFSNSSVVVSIPNSTNFDTPVDLVVESNSGAQTVKKEAFTFRRPGVITDIVPLSGQLGTKVTLTGTSLLGNGSRLVSAILVGVPAIIKKQTNNNVVLEAGAYATNLSTSGPVVLTSDNGAMVTSSLRWTYIASGHIDVVTPSEGQFGSLVNISGTNLLGGGENISIVTLCGLQAKVVFISFNLLVVRAVTNLKRDLPGDVIITANTGARVIGIHKWIYRKQGIITNISPVTGQLGTLVTITGSNVLGYGSQILNITIAQVPVLSVVEQSSLRVVARVGAGAEGVSGNVIIFADTEAVVTSINLTFTFSKPGSISLVTPSSGLEGTLVVIRGTLLHGHGNLTSGVTLNGVPVSQIVYDSETEIIVAAGPTPLASPTQPGNVEITSNTGEIVTKDRIFSYATPVVISSVTPSSGQRGTVVNIALTIKSSAVEVVHVAGTEATVTQRKGNTVVIHLGRPSRQGTFTGDIVVTLQNGSKARRKSGFTYTSEGIIFSINPAQGQIGTIVKVTGQNLLGNGTQIVTASLAGLSGQVVNSSNTEALIVVTERNFIRNLGNLTLTSDNGAIITRVDGWESVPAGLIQSVFPNVGQLGTLVTIRGQRLFGGGTRINSVHLSGIPALRIMSANDSIVIVEAADGDNTTNQTSAVTLTSDTGSIVELQLGWIYKPRGKIVSVSPAIGQFGTHVTIKGYNLLGQGRTVQVSLGQVDALTVESATDTLIVVRANDGMNITGRRESIMITANTGAFTTRKATWTYRARGVITSVYPPNGQYGTEVVVRGLNLFGFGSKIVRATIGGIEASVMQNTNEIVVISAGLCLTSISDVDIILEADSGAQVIAQRVFSYITPGNITSVQPASGLHGTIITITGFQLFGYGIKLKSVSIAGTLAAFDHFAVNSSVITVTAGINAHPVTGPIVITSSSGAIVSYFNWTYVQGGIISALLPAVGRSGIRVTLSGSRLLSGGTTVKCIIVNGSPSFKIESANDTHIQFRLGPPPPAGQSQHGVSVVLTSGSMYSVTANLFAYTSDGGIVTSVNPNAGHGGTTVVIRGSNLLNGGNVSNIFLSGIKVAAILSANETVVVVVAGKGYDATGDVIVASFNGFISGLHNGWQYLPFIPKSAVSPAQGQSGTTVTISAHKALLNFKVKSVIIAGIPAQLQSTSVNRTYFDDRNMSIVEDIQQLSLVAGPLSTATTYTGDIVLQSQTGEQLLISRGWTYLPNQIVDFVSPINGYQGTQVTIIGRNLLAGGTRISSVHLAGISTRIMTEEIDFEGKNVLRVEVLPNKQTQSGISGNIVITSDDGASFVPPGRQWTYLDVQIASFRPKFGQVGTLVTVSGLNLLAGGNSILSATLAGVTATIVKASTSEVVLRANNSTPTGPDDIVLNMDTGAQILLHQGWTYSQPGNITEVQPRIGTEGTVVGITGTDLLGGGKQASNVFLDGVPAREVVASSHLYVEVVVGKGPPGGTTTPGTVIIIANTGATISRSNLFRYAAVGKVTSILPQLGQYGTEVIIRGSDLLSGSSSLQYVKLAGVDATVVGKPTDSMVTVRAGFPPRLDAFTDVIEIRSSSGGIVSSSTVKFSYLRSGQIYTVSPSKGQHGTYVHLAGERLLGGGSTLRAAYLGNVSAFIEKPFTDDSVTIRAGESVQTGNVNVTLVSDNGAIVVKLGFTYLQSSNITTVNPPIGRQGTRIRITGNRLTGGGNNITNVRLSGVQVMSFVEGTGYVDVRAGNGSKAVNLTGDIVITSNTGAQTTLRNGFTYTSPGRVSRLSPSSGISDEEVNITGVDLLGGGSRIVTVTFGSIKAQVIHSSNTSVTVITGPNNDGEPKPNIDVYLEADTGDATYAFGAWSYNASCTGNQFGLYPSNCTNCSAECNRCFNIGNTNCRRCQRFTIPTNSSNGKQCVFSCPNFINGTTCVDKCSKFQFVNISMDTDNKIHKYCYQCSSLCNPNNGCDGPNPTNCTVCLYVRDEGACTDKCPIDKYSDNENNCQPCHSECKKGFGCHGPNEWDCNVCAHFSLTRDTCNFTSTDATGNYCIASCPNDYFVNGSNCLECDDQCLGGCKGSLPHQCHHCAKYVKLQNGLHTCVASCNPESGPYLFYASTNRCERCHPQCSPIGGCTGPEPQDCLQCQNLTLRNTANGTTCVGQCPSKYYADEQFQCNTCDASCTNGCNGPTPSDCTATGTTVGTFDAGTGTVAVVVAICVVLLVIIVLVFVWACCKSSSDRYSVSDILLSSRHEEPSHDETDRQKQVKETSIDGRPPASLPSDHGGLRPLSEVPLLKKQSAVDNYIPMAVSNNAMTDEEYTAMDTPKLVADSVYADSDQPPPTASHQQPAHKSFSSVTLPPPVTQDMYDDVEVDQGELLYEDVNPAAAAKTSKNKARPMSQPSKSTPALLPSTKTKHTAPTLPPRSTKPQGALLPHPPRAQPPAEQPRKLGPKPGSSMQHLPPLQPMNHVSITATKPQFTMQRPEPGQDDEAPVLPPRNANKPYEVDDLYEDCSNIEID